MTDDPLHRYADLINRAHAPRDLSRAVLDRIECEQHEPARPSGPRHQARENGPAPFAVKRHRFRGFALAACIVMLAVIVGVSLVIPRIGKHVDPLGFAITAYGASGNTLLAMGDDGRILFEADILFRVPPADRYAEEGVYTGCMFRIEGSDIVRVQAHIDKGELYRYTNEEFSTSDDPDRWAEAQAWNTTLIGQGEHYAQYDLVQPVNEMSFDGEVPTVETVGVKCYQRLGSTIDLPVSDADGSRLSDYCFGLWTNEDSGVVTGYQDYIDTLDGATLTVTIEKADGSHATRSITLTAADVKAKLVHSKNETTPGIELIPQIVDPFAEDVQQKLDNRQAGFTWIHTLYGTVAEENCNPFPFGDEAPATLDRPLTEPAPERSSEDATEPTGEDVTPEDTWVVSKNPLRPGEIMDVRFPQNATRNESNGSTAGLLTCANAKVSEHLPEGVTVDDLALPIPDDTEASNEYPETNAGFTIADDGTLSEGFAYATIDITVKNTSEDPLYADPTEGGFGTLKQLDGEQYFARSPSSWALWLSDLHYSLSNLNAGSQYALVEPGETKTFTVLHVVALSDIADPTFSFYYRNTSFGGRNTATYHLGSLELS